MARSLHAHALLTGVREVRPGTVTVEGSRVASIGGPVSTQPLDGALMPGFVDVQCNGAAGFDLADATADAFKGTAEALLRAGTTAWCPTLPSASKDLYPRFLDAAADAARGQAQPRILGVHLEGPFLNPARKGAHPAEHLVPPDPEWLGALLDRHPGLVRIVTLAPELPGALDVVALCRERGVTVALGHSDATADEAHAAFDAGATMVTHLFNAMRPIHHRDPGIAMAACSRSDVRCAMITDGVHVDPLVARFFLRAIGRDRAVAVSDSVASPSREGLLTGGLVLLDQAVRNLADWGFAMTDALRMVTINPAQSIGVDGLGSLEPGTVADMVLWREDRVEAVWMDGQLVQGEEPA